MEPDKYRYILGSLYEYDAASHSYIHVYKNARDDTEAKAIAAYEKDEEPLADHEPSLI